MKSVIKSITTFSALAAILGAMSFSPVLAADEKSVMEAGKALSFDRKKGNCLACHAIKDGVSPGNIGPPLIYMSARYKTKEALRAQIYDATVANPDTLMPPFGKHGALSDAEISKIVEFIYSL